MLINAIPAYFCNGFRVKTTLQFSADVFPPSCCYNHTLTFICPPPLPSLIWLIFHQSQLVCLIVWLHTGAQEEIPPKACLNMHRQTFGAPAKPRLRAFWVEKLWGYSAFQWHYLNGLLSAHACRVTLFTPLHQPTAGYPTWWDISVIDQRIPLILQKGGVSDAFASVTSLLICFGCQRKPFLLPSR